MCWACYTPLSGAGSGAAQGPSVATKSPHEADGFKKPIPPWQLGVVGIALLLALGVGAKMMFGGSGDPDSSDSSGITAPAPGRPAVAAPVTITSVPPPPVSPGPPSNSADTAPPPRPDSFSIVAAPDPRFSFGTMAIVPTNPNLNTREAAQLAVFARQQMMRSKKWQILHIYVFANREAGMVFRRYQTARKGAPLGPDDYQKLADLWPNTLVRYEYNRGSEGILIPSRRPSSWWGNKPVYTKARISDTA
jgi:hypothetical protein